MIRVAVFDFDGTLVDSNRVKDACFRRTVAGLDGGAEALPARIMSEDGDGECSDHNS